MMVVDTSALMAVVLDEAAADRVSAGLEGAGDIAMSAVTMAEALVVAATRGVGPDMQRLIEGLGTEIVPVTPADAVRVAAVYQRWGKGLHPAGLNVGDCFSYALAEARACPLLYVGDDFSQTDVRRAS
jgi:ribonuclease VapC